MGREVENQGKREKAEKFKNLHLQKRSISKTESNKWLLILQWEVAREVCIYAEWMEWFSGGPVSFVNFPCINSQAEIQVFLNQSEIYFNFVAETNFWIEVTQNKY